MPLYEYRCPKCGERTELMQKYSDPAPVCVCAEGAPVDMVRQISRGNFILKGSGWYKTDYAKK